MKHFLFLFFLSILFSPASLLANECVHGDCVNGFGKMVMPQGYEFEGQWKDEQPNGKGTATTPYGTTITGDSWINGELQGEGVETYSNGRVYTGEFENTKYNGVGTDKYPDGRVYAGEFTDGHPQGKGKLTNQDGSIYEGDFVDGRPQGKGIYTYPNGEKYEGELKNGGPHGYGISYFPDGKQSFAGQWKNGEEIRE